MPGRSRRLKPARYKNVGRVPRSRESQRGADPASSVTGAFMGQSKKLVRRSTRDRATSLERRRFLQKGALAGAALVSTPAVVAAQASQAAAAPAQAPPAPMTLAAETTPPGDVQVLGDDERCG